MDAPNDFQPLMDDILREKVLRARATPPEERMTSALELFEMGVSMMRAGIVGQFPDATPEQVEREVQRRFDVIRRAEEHGLYRPVT